LGGGRKKSRRYKTRRYKRSRLSRRKKHHWIPLYYMSIPKGAILNLQGCKGWKGRYLAQPFLKVEKVNIWLNLS
jgi:hypothetical protein